MLSLLSSVLLFLLQAGAPANGLEVQAHEGHVTVRAQRVPLSKVLDRLAQQTGMKVVYESSPPSQPVSANFEGLQTRDAVVRLLEGQGLAYVFRTDASGRRVETLLVSGEASGGPGGSGGGNTFAGGGQQPDAMEYTAEVVDDTPDYEEPAVPDASIPVQDLALPGGVIPNPNIPQPLDPGPSFPGGPGFPRTPGSSGFPGSPPGFPGPVSNPFPN